MKVLLTGATGFLGSYVLRALLAEGDVETTVVLRPESDPWRIADVIDKTRVVCGRLGDREFIAQVSDDATFDCVIHLAWDGVLGKSRNDIAQYRNVDSALQLVEAAVKQGASWIGIGSQAEYGPCSQRIDEATPTHPTTVYGAAKLATCILAERICSVAGVRFAWLRLFSSYGPKDHTDWMIPYLTTSLLRGNRPSLTEGKQLWDYLYVADAAEAIATVARKGGSGIFNLGSGNAARLRDVVGTLRDLIDPSLEIGWGEVPYRPDQVMHLEADITRLRALGWQPRTQLSEGLAKTISWYRDAHAA